MEVIDVVRKAVESSTNRAGLIAKLRALLHELSPTSSQPIDHVEWVPAEKIHANDYNPNAVAKNEMALLYTSIKHDGYTQPIVAVYDPEHDRYVIVDGFHRYSVLRSHSDIRARTNGLLPLVVLKKSLNDRMASTIRHNRARGKHSVAGMASLIFSMLDNGWSDSAICAQIGLEADELIRLKHVTGFSKLFENVEYRKAWETKSQIQLRKKYEREHAEG